jgi:hypothetical protein
MSGSRCRQALETRIVLQEQTVYLQDTTDKVEKLAGTSPQAKTKPLTSHATLGFVAHTVMRGLHVLLVCELGFLPRVNQVVGRIKGRKWRDLVILGGFIAICICALLLYWLSYR